MSTDKSGAPGGADSQRSIIKATGILALGALTSKILGFVRDIVLAKILGTGFKADALFVAFRIPNMFREMVGEGASNSAVVPVISEYRVTRSPEEFWRFISSILLAATVVLSLITLVGMCLAPVLVRLLAPGFISDPQKILLTTRLTKILFPYLIFIGLTAYTMAVLNTFRHFSTPAFSPAILNIVVIAGVLFSAHRLAEPVYGVAVSILIGGVLQLVFQLVPLSKTGIQWKHRPQLFHPGVAKVGKLLLPRLFGSGVYQLNLFVDTFCASLASIVGAGGIAAIYYSNRLIQFPIGIFGLASAAAILPTLSAMAAKRDMAGLRKTMIFSLENILLAMFPASVLMIVLAVPMIRVLFERGEFDQYSTMITSSALIWYALGLWSFSGAKILVTAFHALQDTRTPVKVATGCLIINAILNFVLMFPMKIAGIALASTISSGINFIWLFSLLKRQTGPMESEFKKFIFKILSASLMMAAGILWLKAYLQGVRSTNEILYLVLEILAGSMIYVGLCYALGIRQIKRVLAFGIK